VRTKGNPFCHLILRGGEEPNYDEATLQNVTNSLQREGLRTGFIVDCSHGNSKKEYLRQILVALHINRIRYAGLYPIRGIMLESNLEKGNQPLSANLRRGVSITDACLDVPSTKDLLQLLNTMYIVSCETIRFARESIRRMDVQICKILRREGHLSIQHMPSKFHYEMDSELLDICKPYANAEHMLMMLSTRLSFSNRVAELKFAANPFGFLQSDPMNRITDRDVEREIVALDPLFLQIIDLSKRVQLRCIEDLCRTFRIGYLFGPGTFSSEAVSTLKGQHIAFPTKDALMTGLQEGAVDAVLLPTYNSILGDIYPIDSKLVKGCIEHPIQLSLYSNRYMDAPFSADTLYVEPHILKECCHYVTHHVSVKKIQVVNSTREGCLAMLRDEGSAFTIASVHNEFTCMYTLAKNIVDHNVTTFSFVMRTQTQHAVAFSTIDACIDSHCR
jgi:chorismate mutase